MKLIFTVTEDWYFYSHRLPMARAAQRAGYDVAVVTSDGDSRAAIEGAGIRVIPFAFERRSLNPLRSVPQIMALAAIYRRERPDVVHNIAMKPVLYGSMAASLARVPRVVNAFAGLGYLFTSDEALAQLLRAVLVPVFRLLLKRPGRIMLLQNPDDRALLARLRMIEPNRTIIIRGSGVDLGDYAAAPLPPAPPFVCAFAGRMIDIKGLPTMKDAFARLAKTHPHIRLWLCGTPDAANPGSWTEQALHDWAAHADNVEYRGRSRMADIWRDAHLAVQPSWGGEGIPKSLLEAAACGRPIVATDVPGCRETVVHGENGLLVPPRDAKALADAIAGLADNMDRCHAMAARSRAIVEGDLSSEGVSAQAEQLYRSLAPHVDKNGITSRSH